MAQRPNSMRHLDNALRRLSGGAADRYVRIRTLLSNAIVAQLLPDGVMKGGSALRMRYGSSTTRFTTDLDTATGSSPASYLTWGNSGAPYRLRLALTRLVMRTKPIG